jgi:hypothetical protein
MLQSQIDEALEEFKTPPSKPTVYPNVTPYAKLQLAANKRFEAAAAQEARTPHVVDYACFFQLVKLLCLPDTTRSVATGQRKGKDPQGCEKPKR